MEAINVMAVWIGLLSLKTVKEKAQFFCGFYRSIDIKTSKVIIMHDILCHFKSSKWFNFTKNIASCSSHSGSETSCTNHLAEVMTSICKKCQSQQSKELMYGKIQSLFIGISMDILPKTNSSPLKIGHPKRALVFQPSIFRCYVSFRGGNLHSRPDSLSERKEIGGSIGNETVAKSSLLMTPAAQKGLLCYHF